jgi:hypothetical protein
VKENVVLSEDSRSSEKFMHGIKVLMAKNYIDNLGEEVRKGMIEKARQGHWPTVAPVGYQNNLATHRIEPDPGRAPIIVKLFEWYASGEYSLKALTRKAAAVGLTNRTGGSPLVKAKIHQLLQNPIYYGDFFWLGQLHHGVHKPIISRDLFTRVQDVFTAANHPRHTKRQHAFAGIVTCGRCGCSFTAETKKGQYVYYHCTGHRGPCGNTYVREEELVRQFGEILKQIRIPHELAGKLATVLRESQADKEKFVRTSMLRLQQQQMLLRSKLDRVYEDRLSDVISDELWTTKSGELQEELRRVRAEMERHEGASQAYETAGLQILELAQSAYSSYVTKNPREQARLVKTVVSNSTFDRGSLSPTYIKPFDVFANGGRTGDWLLRLDSYEAGGCQVPCFSQCSGIPPSAPRNRPRRTGPRSSEFSEDVNDRDAPLVQQTIKSWRLRVAGAAWLPRYSYPCRRDAPSTRALLVKPGSERPFSNSVFTSVNPSSRRALAPAR